jgi:ABC-2 type transport system ATP-binding protein
MSMSVDPVRPVSASGPESAPIVAVEGLTRVFRRRGAPALTAVDAMTFRIAPGEAVGYIGANGAGKSTTIKMLTGILAPTSGTARTVGLDPMRDRRELARRVGVVFGQRSQLWWDLPLRESFDLLAAIHRLDPARATRRTGQLVELLDLGPTLAQPVRSLSLGQRMRAEVAAALLHEPELVILDEPTIGLDVLSKARLREFLIQTRREHGTTLLLTTHDMGDIERLCDRVLVVDHGRLAFDGTLAGLAGTVGAGGCSSSTWTGPVSRCTAYPTRSGLAPKVRACDSGWPSTRPTRRRRPSSPRSPSG